MLWFDVGIKRYTTERKKWAHSAGLWFDVGIKRYTTIYHHLQYPTSCGLM